MLPESGYSLLVQYFWQQMALMQSLSICEQGFKILTKIEIISHFLRQIKERY